jgi:hypothetical protein
VCGGGGGGVGLFVCLFCFPPQLGWPVCCGDLLAYYVIEALASPWLELKTVMIYSVAFCFTIFFCFPVFPHGTQCSSSLFFSSECSLFFVTQNLLIQ